MAKVGAYYYVEAERMSEVRGIISMACMQFRMTMIIISRRHFGCNKQGGNRVPFLYRTAGSAKIDGLSRPDGSFVGCDHEFRSTL